MNRTQVYQLSAELAQQLPSLKRKQADGLAMACAGLSQGKHCGLSRMAESIPEMGSVNTVRQRLKRWVKDETLCVQSVCEEWVAWVWSRWQMKRALLLVDETKLQDRLGVMMVSLAYAKRAIPLMWRCYTADEAGAYPAQGQVLLIYGLLAHVLSALPAHARPLVQMDRGLAHSAAMLRVLNALGVDYLVRVKATARFTEPTGTSFLLHERLTPGIRETFTGTLFSRDHAVTGTLHLVWDVGQTEGWCLFTNTPDLCAMRYALRWWQEESFRDLKSGGWQWEASRLRCPARMERLLLVLALTYAWALALGVQAQRHPARARAGISLDDLRRYSVFRLGLRWLRFLCHCRPDQVRMAQPFAPPDFSYSA